MVRCLADLCYAHPMTPMEAPLWMTPRVSRRAVQACAGVHLLVVVLCLVAWPWSPALLVAIALLVAGGRAGVETLRALPREFIAVLLAADGRWTLTDRHGERLVAVPCGVPLVAPWFVVVPLRAGTRRYCWFAGLDTLPPDTFRRLRLRLRFGPAAHATVSAAV